MTRRLFLTNLTLPGAAGLAAGALLQWTAFQYATLAVSLTLLVHWAWLSFFTDRDGTMSMFEVEGYPRLHLGIPRMVTLAIALAPAVPYELVTLNRLFRNSQQNP